MALNRQPGISLNPIPTSLRKDPVGCFCTKLFLWSSKLLLCPVAKGTPWFSSPGAALQPLHPPPLHSPIPALDPFVPPEVFVLDSHRIPLIFPEIPLCSFPVSAPEL